MRVNFVFQSYPNNWSSQFVSLISQGLRRLGNIVNEVNTTGMTMHQCRIAMAAAPEADVWYFAHLTDWMIEEAAGFQNIPVVSHVHGGPETSAMCDVWPSPRVDFSYQYAAVKRVTVNSFSHAQQILITHGFAKTEVIGFPLDLQQYSPNRQKLVERDLILVPGRLEEDKQPVLLAHALAPYKERVVFTTGDDYGSSGISPTYSYLVNSGYRVITKCRGAEYRRALQQALVVVSASLADTLNVSIVESIASGAYPVLPDIPVFAEYSDTHRYLPYCVKQIRELVEVGLSGHRAKSSIEKYDHAVVVKKLHDVLIAVTQ